MNDYDHIQCLKNYEMYREFRNFYEKIILFLNSPTEFIETCQKMANEENTYAMVGLGDIFYKYSQETKDEEIKEKCKKEYMFYYSGAKINGNPLAYARLILIYNLDNNEYMVKDYQNGINNFLFKYNNDDYLGKNKYFDNLIEYCVNLRDLYNSKQAINSLENAPNFFVKFNVSEYVK